VDDVEKVEGDKGFGFVGGDFGDKKVGEALVFQMFDEYLVVLGLKLFEQVAPDPVGFNDVVIEIVFAGNLPNGLQVGIEAFEVADFGCYALAVPCCNTAGKGL